MMATRVSSNPYFCTSRTWVLCPFAAIRDAEFCPYRITTSQRIELFTKCDFQHHEVLQVAKSIRGRADSRRYCI